MSEDASERRSPAVQARHIASPTATCRFDENALAGAGQGALYLSECPFVFP